MPSARALAHAHVISPIVTWEPSLPLRNSDQRQLHNLQRSLLDKGLGGPPAERRQWLNSLPGHRLLLASCPLNHPADDLQYLTETALCSCDAATTYSSILRGACWPRQDPHLSEWRDRHFVIRTYRGSRQGNRSLMCLVMIGCGLVHLESGSTVAHPYRSLSIHCVRFYTSQCARFSDRAWTAGPMRARQNVLCAAIS